MKHLLSVFLLCLVFSTITNAQTQSNWWMISSEFSPVSRSSPDRVLNSTGASNLEWRNRIGFKLGEQTFMGISGSYRSTSVEEYAEYEDRYGFTGYRLTLGNNLLGIGTFVSQYFEISPRFHLQATAFGMVEQGKGQFVNTVEKISCPVCFENGFWGPYPPYEVENTSFRERNFFAGIEFGASYFLTARWLLQTNLTLFQYENFRNSGANLEGMNISENEAYRSINQEGSNFTFFTQRPVVHVGVIVMLGK